LEDNEELRHFLKESLSPFYQVMEAADGKEGLARAQEIAPGMIISDLIMPGMNGFDLCRAVKQDIDTCHIPFLMLTARTAASGTEGGTRMPVRIIISPSLEHGVVTADDTQPVRTGQEIKGAIFAGFAGGGDGAGTFREGPEFYENGFSRR